MPVFAYRAQAAKRREVSCTIGLTNSSGVVVERYGYTAYGQLSLTSGSGGSRSWSTNSNRYLYTGREWDDSVKLYYFRARWYEPLLGSFVGRDPLSYADGNSLYRINVSMSFIDPSGAIKCKAACKTIDHWTARRFKDEFGVWIEVKVPVYETRIFEFMTGTGKSPCPEGWSVASVDCPKTVDGVCEQLGKDCHLHNRCAKCNKEKLDQILRRIRELAPKTVPIKGIWNPCERWCMGFEQTKHQWMDDDCIISANCEHALYISNPVIWRAGHVALKLVLCDGSILYVDNGFIGGRDHVGLPSDAPGYVPPFAWTHDHRCKQNWEYASPYR